MKQKLSFQLSKFRQYIRLIPDYFILRSSRLFDKSWYLKTNPDVERAGVNPVWHYLQRGGFEGRDPSLSFYSRWYLEAYEDVRAAGMNPLVHYLKQGRKEGRRALPFSSNNDEGYADLQLIRSSGMFDGTLYLEEYPDVARAGIDPLHHYLHYGGFEGRDLQPHFFSRWYMDTYEDVRNAGINPLVHYLKYGQKEGRLRVPPDYKPRDRRTSMNYSRYVYLGTLIRELINTIEQMYPSSTRNLLNQYLSDLKQEICQKRERIYSRQKQGLWRVTSGDQVFIRYLDTLEAIISPMISNKRLTKITTNKIKASLTKLIESLESAHNPKINVAFFAQETSVWTSLASVYQAFLADERCETQLVYLPFEHRNNDKNINWFAIYKGMGLHVQNYYWYNLPEESPDIVFFSKPYAGVPVRFYIDSVDGVVERCVYIPYWVNWMALQNIPFLIDFHFRLPLLEKAWKIFDAPDYVRASHVQYGPRKGENLELIGHPRFDAIRTLGEIKQGIPDSWRTKIANKMVFMWNTHAYLPNKQEENWSTFGILGKHTLDYFRNNQEIVLLWRPHPHFFNSLINDGGMSAEEVEELVTMASNSGNIILDTTPSYLSAFSVADALMSDASSLLVEFLPTSKPILYTYIETSYSIVNENLLPALYKANTWKDVLSFIRMLLEGKDNKLSERMKVVEDFMPNMGKNVGELVKNKCIEDLTAEETDSGKALAQKYKESVHPLI